MSDMWNADHDYTLPSRGYLLWESKLDRIKMTDGRAQIFLIE